MWKRGEITPKEQFLLFFTLFYIYISNFRSHITYSFVKCGCSIYCFPHSLNSNMSGYCFSESLGIRDNENRLYFLSLQIKLVKLILVDTYTDHVLARLYVLGASILL